MFVGQHTKRSPRLSLYSLTFINSVKNANYEYFVTIPSEAPPLWICSCTRRGSANSSQPATG